MINFENDNDEDFDQFEFERIAKLAQEDTRKAILSHIRNNEDRRNKTVGDQIIVWDCSRLTNAETGELDYEINTSSILSNYPSIVIEDRNKYVAVVKTFAGEFSKNLDLIVWNKTLNKKFRTSSDFVKLYEPVYV